MSNTYLEIETGNITELKELTKKIEAINPHWYWFEPDTAAYIDKETPVQTLNQYSDTGILDHRFQELLLFGKNAGITVIPDQGNNEKYRYFYWQEASDSADKNNELLECTKNITSAFTYAKEAPKKQFGIPVPENIPAKFQLIEYLHNQQRIAWTIIDKGEKQND